MNTMHNRQGQMELEHVYFYTETIHEFKPLLEDNPVRQAIEASTTDVDNLKQPAPQTGILFHVTRNKKQ